VDQRAGGLTIGLLGPLEITANGRPVTLASGRLRTLLAVLALSAGRPVTVERLATALWGEDLPANTRRTVQTYLTRLRAAIGAETIVTGPTGYQLRIDPDRVDALRFARLLDQAARRDQLAEALDLWRGTPFDGIRSDWLERIEAPRLTELRLTAIERRIDLDLADGHPHELVAELHELTSRHPLRESLWVRLLRALARAGRPAEALERYETIRVRLANELGTDPVPELRQVHTDLLAGRPDLLADRAADPAPTPRPVTPRQLPADLDAFTGRHAALKALDDLISEGDGPGARAMMISAIAGTAGVGKTALAIHWAHQVADRFPDGQLYLNLRGFHPSGQAVEPTEAIRGLLDALGIPRQRVPSDLDAQAGLFRSLLAGKRILILLDNARDADQVRPLLPGSPTCLVIVTSRTQLTSLIATEAARPLVLDLLTIDEARELLVRRLGPDRTAAEPAATDEIITSCARLPLALAIAAAHAATHASFPLATLAARLREARSDLDAFAAGDPATDARAAFSWSYRTLTTEAARLFRLLGLHPGPDLAAPAAASLAGLPLPETSRLLAELTRAHLLTEHAPGRYACHDLLRSYATELTHAHDSGPERRAARHRLLDHYLHTGYAASRLAYPHRDPIALAPPQPGVTVEDVADSAQALAWFTAEHRVLLSVVGHADDAGPDGVWQLAWALVEFLNDQGHWHDSAATQRTALEAARRQGDRARQAYAHRTLGRAYSWLDRHQDARDQLGRAIELYDELGDSLGQIFTHFNLSWVCNREHRIAEALHHSQRALDLCRATGRRQARALNAVGWYQAQLGDYQQALGNCQQALELHREAGIRDGEAAAWDSLGYIHHHLGSHQRAIDCYRHAVDLSREGHDRYHEAFALTNLGDTYLAVGEPDSARVAWRQAVVIFDELGLPDIDRVRAKLTGLDP
jgi:DNA-binding SARP family transcriptional activator/Tfp pilus assembly protein PilF